METAVIVVWIVGLLGALLATGGVLKLSLLVLRSLRHLLALAERTARAAEGIADNLEPLPRLQACHEPAGQTREAAAAIHRAMQGEDASGEGPGAGPPSGGQGAGRGRGPGGSAEPGTNVP